MQSNTGLTRSIASGLPPTINVSVPVCACSEVLPTGASTMSKPRRRSSSPTRWDVRGSIVLMSMTTPP